MRQDMHKVITERPRDGGNGSLWHKGYKKRLQREGIDMVQRESIKKLRG